MWNYIMGKYLAKTMKEYRTVIVVTAYSIALPFSIAGCAPGEWDEFWSEQRRHWDIAAAESQHSHSNYDPAYWDRMSWRTQRATEELKVIENQQRLEGYLIREHTRKMLKKMELERKMRELERPR